MKQINKSLIQKLQSPYLLYSMPRSMIIVPKIGTGKQIKGPTTRKKMWYVHTMEEYLSMKRNAVPIYSITQINSGLHAK
jgi:hypothetical protein